MKIIQQFIKEVHLLAIGITAMYVLILLLSYKFEFPMVFNYILLLAYAIMLFIMKMDSRLPILAALLLLIQTPFYLIQNFETYANYLATLAYFFLVIGVIKQFVEYVKEQRKKQA